MIYDNKQYDSIDLVALLANIFRHWKAFILCMLVGAFLLGGYKYAFPSTKQDNVLTAEQQAKIAELQAALDANTAALNANSTQLATNTSTIEADKKRIPANEELIETQQDLLESLESTLAIQQDAMNHIQDTLDSDTLSEDAMVDLMIQLASLTNDILDTNIRISSAAQQIQSLQDEITNWEDEIETLTANNQSLKTTVQDLQTQVDQQQADLEALQGPQTEQPAVKTGIPVTYLVIGAFLGAVLLCGILFLRYITDKKLQSATFLKDRYQLPILGEFYSKAAKARKDHKAAHHLDVLSGDTQTLPEEEKIYALIAAAIQAAAPVSLLLTGTIKEDRLQETTEKLRPLLSETIQLSCSTNPVYNAQILAHIKDYSVLLVEAKHVSDRSEIDALAELLCRNEVPVIGAVVL